MKKNKNEILFNIRFISTFLLLTVSTATATFRLHKLNKEVNNCMIILNTNERPKDLHIASSLDFVDSVNEKIKIEIEEEEKQIMEVALFNSNNDYYDLNDGKYITDKELLDTDNFVITTDNKTYEYLSYQSFRLFASVVAAEAKNDGYDALATASSMLNRCDSKTWVKYLNDFGKDGEDPIEQLTFEGQYSGYLNGDYEDYFYGNKEIPSEVYEACYIAWFEGIRNNNYCSFRASHVTDYSDIQIVEGGNRFDDEVEPIKTYK